MTCLKLSGAPGEIRTPDPLLRRYAVQNSKCCFWCRLQGSAPFISLLNWTEDGLKWLRAPQPGFAQHILRIRSRTSRKMTGRPRRPRRTFQVQNKLKPARCQATTLSGLTMVNVRAPVSPEVRQTDPQQAVRYMEDSDARGVVAKDNHQTFPRAF
jgi:hypothetical protein